MGSGTEPGPTSTPGTASAKAFAPVAGKVSGPTSANSVPVAMSRGASATLPPGARAISSPAERNPSRAARPTEPSSGVESASTWAATCANPTSTARLNSAKSRDSANNSSRDSPVRFTPSRAQMTSAAARMGAVINVMRPVNHHLPTSRDTKRRLIAPCSRRQGKFAMTAGSGGEAPQPPRRTPAQGPQHPSTSGLK